MKMICGECDITTTFKLIEKVNNGINRIYLKCRDCGKEYDVMYQDDEVKELIRQNRKFMGTKIYKDNKKIIDELQEPLKRKWEGK